MENDVAVSFDDETLRWISEALKTMPRRIPRLITRVLNRTANTIRVRTVKRIAGEVMLKQKQIRPAVKVLKARFTQQIAAVRVASWRFPLLDFSARQIKSGVSYRISRKAGRKRIKSAFIASVGVGGHRGVFKRVGTRRLPIQELRGPSIPAVLEDAPGMLKGLEEEASVELAKNIDAQIALMVK